MERLSDNEIGFIIKALKRKLGEYKYKNWKENSKPNSLVNRDALAFYRAKINEYEYELNIIE